ERRAGRAVDDGVDEVAVRVGGRIERRVEVVVLDRDERDRALRHRALRRAERHRRLELERLRHRERLAGVRDDDVIETRRAAVLDGDVGEQRRRARYLDLVHGDIGTEADGGAVLPARRVAAYLYA